ncbi:MAG: ATP-dependent DNA helicase RecG [Candidatus Nealsonbacteria bacterium CG_4_9_14_3_um_filter_35_11]|uniref:Probable DNA 3'-5' helicase RecG n=2 Tax=Candidatus Nealsoniibacteriota TaxID=1817911 RepID=A0A2M7DB08_9BACT|nr:MAG: ATP-dependent DNA helicase RecG [Candidatus Nealsonbacteria bacterium CG11_big_fil_rev_8_21_14_0_20_35_11]PIV45587.1 MAG: ATP-dependent DNA helicase RecG [Candidatus Nealsonbacteria bacterium CG02_land_8_20_14_3_00_34_20]PIW92606.1 MAG: ATP-dependent DNA helicase RecG [Candidatus Nealsonbacteria bacterium CG_4_8_14_3_um_filter_34_13]PIZ89922.1 MAG: ATP-dependent DNA helicase RecG [Candidatus Nealsonbacteria bacterium CG_4_10_14_0_2_um_filter_35_20]PJA84856.1 MAG: ATP-dependent DNA helic
MNFSTPVEKIPGIGLKYQKRLNRLGIKTLGELLFYFPHHYGDFSKITKIKEIKLNERSCFKGKILEIKQERTWKRKIILTKAIVEDDSGAIQVIWFNQPYLIKVLKKGDKLIMAGKIVLGDKQAYLSSPVYEKIPETEDKIQDAKLTHLGRIVPVYSETEGLSSRWLRYILKPLLLRFKNKIPETLPEIIRKKEQLLNLSSALWQIHFPDSLKLARAAQNRFSFEELFFISLFNLKRRAKMVKAKAQSFPINVPLIQEFVKSLPFKLTSAQKKVSWQILKDLEKPYPMNRLLQGDVGSGKTVVSAIASINVIKAGNQVALMAPTEILAKQHFQTFFQIFNQQRSFSSSVNIGFLTGNEDKFYSRKLKSGTIEISRQKLLEKTKTGGIDILIGTHALITPIKKGKSSSLRVLENKVKFKNLGLIIIDEQHRFGVEQRAKLAGKKTNWKIPHLLSMTATPIPRSLTLTIWGDLDLSIIDELPKGRKKVITEIVSPQKREKVYQFARSQAKNGRQIFVICPRIEEKEDEVKSVEKEYKILSEKVFPDLKVKMLHGKMTPKEKEGIMREFKQKKFDILVSTSVVEVGIDVKDATIMIIEGTERFGLAQLHQFRGRVGRSKKQSFCFLFTESSSKKTKERLKALINCNSGFELSEMDLKIRGPGDFFGVKQWGLPDLAMSALKNIKLVEKAREAAKEILKEDSELRKYSTLKRRLEVFEEKVHLE